MNQYCPRCEETVRLMAQYEFSIDKNDRINYECPECGMTLCFEILEKKIDEGEFYDNNIRPFLGFR